MAYRSISNLNLLNKPWKKLLVKHSYMCYRCSVVNQLGVQVRDSCKTFVGLQQIAVCVINV